MQDTKGRERALMANAYNQKAITQLKAQIKEFYERLPRPEKMEDELNTGIC